MIHFFIGGPLNNQLRDLRGSDPWTIVRVRSQLPAVEFSMDCPTLDNTRIDFVDYYPDAPLPTGCPVMSIFTAQCAVFGAHPRPWLKSCCGPRH